MTANNDWARLAAAVRDRRTELGLTQQGVQDVGGPSSAKVRELENQRTQSFSPSKRRDLERALQWKERSVDAVLAGGEPTPLPKAVSHSGSPLPPHINPTVTTSIEFESAQPEMDYLLRLMREGRTDEIPPGRLAELGETLTIERFVERYPHLERALQLDIAEYAATAEHAIRMRQLELSKETEDDITTEPATEDRSSEEDPHEKTGAADRRVEESKVDTLTSPGKGDELEHRRHHKDRYRPGPIDTGAAAYDPPGPTDADEFNDGAGEESQDPDGGIDS